MTVYQIIALKLREYVKKYGKKLYIGFSGGIDSSVLLHQCASFRNNEAEDIAITALHLNHMIRDKAAEDEVFCGKQARKLGVELISEKIDVPAYCKEHKVSIETGARECRLAFFREHAAAVLLAHHSDDAAETVLFNILRGTGFRGASGMTEGQKVGDLCLLRPFLEISKADITACGAEWDIQFREDETNSDSSYTRNRIRNELFPVMEKINPGFRNNLLNTSFIINEGWEIISSLIKEVEKDIILESDENRVGFDVEKLMHSKLASFLIYAKMDELGITADRPSVGKALNLISRAPGGSVDEQLKDGGLLRYEYGKLYLLKGEYTSSGFEKRILSIPGECRVPELDLTVRAERIPVTPELRENLKTGTDPYTEVMDLGEADSGSLVIRPRRDGDRFYPLGSPGERKLQDVLVDKKVPLADRDRLVVIENGAGEIIWVAGVRISERFKVTDRTRLGVRLSVNSTH